MILFRFFYLHLKMLDLKIDDIFEHMGVELIIKIN